jgi:hypothetical protein
MGERTPRRDGPYRTNARALDVVRTSPGRHGRATNPIRLLGLPRYAGLAVVAVVAISLGSLNVQSHGREVMLTPNVEHIENRVAYALLFTIPVVAILVAWAWRRLPAPRATKWKHIARSTLTQTCAVAVGVIATVAIRPSSPRLIGSSEPRNGRAAYVQEWDWGCGYKIAVGDGQYAVRPIAAIGPFPCDAPPPHVEWRGSDVALVAADGETLGTWPADR